MKILKNSEVGNLVFAANKTKNYTLYLLASQLEVNQSLQLDRGEWTSKNPPNLNHRKVGINKSFVCRRLLDGGFIITRVK